MPTPGQYPLELDYIELKANMRNAWTFFNSPAGTINLNLVGNDNGTLADLKQQVLDIAGQYSNVTIAQNYTALSAVTPTQVPALGYTLEDDGANLAGFYEWTASNPVWTYRTTQQVSTQTFDAFKTETNANLTRIEAQADNALAEAGSPRPAKFEFYNEYPVPAFLANAKYLELDVDNRVFNSIDNDGTSNIRGITDVESEGIIAQYEFYNSPNLPSMGVAVLDVDGRVFDGYTPDGLPLFAISGSSGTSGIFELDLLKQLLINIFYGQSLSVGSQGLPVLSTTQPYPHLTFGAGPKATKAGSLGDNPGMDTVKPLVEDDASNLTGPGSSTNGETTCSGMANYTTVLLAEDGINPEECVIFSSTAGHGGYRLDQLNENSAWFQVWKDHVDESVARSIELGRQPIIPVIPWVQGESDQGNPLFTYAPGLDSLRRAQVNYIKQKTKQIWEPPMHMYQTYASRSSDRNGSASAQLWLARNLPTKYRLVTPVYFLPHAPDGTHLTNVGYKWMGCYFSRAFRDVILNRKPINFIMPSIPEKIDLSTIRISHTSGYPLQLMNKVTQNGYQVRVNDVVVPVSVALNGNDIILTLSTPMNSLNNQVVVTYAREFKNPDLMPINGGCGDLCDTDPTTVVIDGVTYGLQSWCPSYVETARLLII